LLSLTVALAAAAPLVAQIPIPLSTKTDTLIIDNDGDGVADPGDTIRYSVVYTNAGTGNATNVFFTDALDANTTLAAGSVKTTPIARHDFYPVLGNVGLTVPAGSGLIAGLSPASADNDPDGGTVMANPVGSAATATSGTISIAADGSFTYDPPAGYEGSDSFVYGIIDDEGQTDQAIVFFTISDMVWFVDSSSGSGNGSFSSPFNSIADFNAIQGASIPNAKPGDAVFVYQGSGTYVNGTFLQNSQALLGQGVDLLTELASLLISVPAFSNLASSPPSGTAFRPTLTNAAGDGITLAQNNLIRGLDIGNTSGVGISDGGASVGSATIDQVAISGTGGGLEIDNGGSLAVTLDSLSASSSADEGIHLAGVGGAFAITATDGNISTSGVPAIVIDGNPSVAINITMTSVAANGAANGILIQDTTGSFTVTGSGSTDGSGGTIASITHRGGSFINASSISLSNMTFSNASTSNAAGNCTNLVHQHQRPAGDQRPRCHQLHPHEQHADWLRQRGQRGLPPDGQSERHRRHHEL
jgi:uncharacterized repeat protein (TIGR01451 family)